uniref:Uncharacterized protein n=1 Tax=Anopheles maculatus TaxID=74869 RepID=A0A182T4F5_9DIPT
MKIMGTENLEGFAPNITKSYKLIRSCSFVGSTNVANVFFHNRNRYVTESETSVDLAGIDHDGDEDDIDSNNVIEGAARSKVSRSSVTESMGLSGGLATDRPAGTVPKIFASLLFIIVLNSFRIATV